VTTGVAEFLTFVVLMGGLLVMIRGARGPGGPARSWRELSSYDLEGQMWAVALVAGVALGEIVATVEGGLPSFSTFALGLGVWCGWFRTPTRLAGLVPGTVGAFASVFGSLAFVAHGATPQDQVFRAGVVFSLALLFALAIITRVQPLAGLTWFAALDVVVFTSGPAGVSWAEIAGWPVGVLALVAIGVAASFALLPEALIALTALAVVAVQVIGAGFGYLPGSLLYSVTPIVLTLIGYSVTRAIRRRVLG